MTGQQTAGGKTPWEDGIVGQSDAISKLRRRIRKMGDSDAPTLIIGESGTGKELVASAIHNRSERAGTPFVAVNCGAIPASLIQSELFGHEKGAFTGASARRLGKIESAKGGTLFLDEIGDLPMDMQASLLRFLQEGRIQRLGSVREIAVDVRVIAATHVDLVKAIALDQFRDDLYYRLSVLNIKTPSLRERGPEDVELLARHFLARFASAAHSQDISFAADALAALRCQPWPGNVRELMNRIHSAVVMTESSEITALDLGFEAAAPRPAVLTLEDARREAEIAVIERALDLTQRNITESARLLGVTRNTLYRLMDKYRGELGDRTPTIGLVRPARR